MKTLAGIGFTCAGVAGVILSILKAARIRDTYIGLYGDTLEANALIIRATNATAFPMLLFSLVLFMIVGVLLHINRRVK